MGENTLVVEDTPANRDFLERLLISAGFDVVSVPTAKEALDAAAKMPQLRLALVDMELPDMDGVRLTAALRQTYPDVCIVVATMHDDRRMIEDVFAHGGNIFLVKPHGFMELYKRLTTMDLAQLREGEPTVIDQYGPRTYSLAR